MQYPVPQFTDVEDKIIGPLTLRQFGIVGGAGVLVFLGFSATKSFIVAIILGLIFGLPALAIAFGKLNGRPLYSSFGSITSFFLKPRKYLFNKQMDDHLVTLTEQSAVPPEAKPAAASTGQATAQLKQINYQLHQNRAEEEQLSRNNSQSQ